MKGTRRAFTLLPKRPRTAGNRVNEAVTADMTTRMTPMPRL